MNILVTGSSGFIGSHLTRALRERGDRIVALVHSPDKAEALERTGVEVLQGDLADTPSLEGIMDGIDAVYHLAALRGEGRGPREYYRKVNVYGTRALLEEAVKSGVRHFIYVSTVGVMGWVRKLPATEEHACKPEGAYHETKLEAEKLALRYHRKEGLPVTVIRPTITYGPRDDGMLYKLARLITKGRFHTIGSGENRMHLLYVENLVPALLNALEEGRPRGETYIIADPEPITLNQLVSLVARCAGAPVPRHHIPVWLARMAAEVSEASALIGVNPIITKQSVDILVRDRCYSTEKARKKLVYRPAHTTEEGVKETVAWFKEHGKI